MVKCAQETTDGMLSVVSASDVSMCQFVMVTPYEYDKFLSSPFALTIQDSLQIGGAICLLWASAWSVRTVINFFSKGENNDEP